MKSWTSARRNVLLVSVPVYSPGRSKKKKAMTIMSEIALLPHVPAAQKATARTWWITCIGMGFTRDGGGSALA